MTIPMQALVDKIVQYRIDEATEDILCTTDNSRVHTGTANILYMLLYILVKNWGNQRYFLLDSSEGVVLPTIDDYDNLSTILNPESMLGMEAELKTYGIYLEDAASMLHDFKSTLVILNTRDVSSADMLCLALKTKLANLLPMDAKETLDSISPEFLYIEGITDYKHYRELSARLNRFGCTSILLYVDSASYVQQIDQIKHEQMVSAYMKMLGNQKYLSFTEQSPWVQQLSDRLGVPTFDTVKRAYEYIINLPENLFIIDSMSFPAAAIEVLALAYCTHHKQSIFNYAFADAVYNAWCKKFFARDFAYLDSRIKAISEQYIPEIVSVHLGSPSSSIIRCNYLQLNLAFKLADADDLLSFLKVTDDDVLIAIESDVKHTPVKIYNQRQLDLDATFIKDGLETYRYDYDNIISFLERRHPNLTLRQTEHFIYSLLRLMEQLMESYSTIHTIYDILVVEDLETGKHLIGLGSMDPEVNCDIIQMGSICCVIPDKILKPSFLDIYSIFDLTNLLPNIKRAYEDSNMQPPKLKVSKYILDKQYLVDMAIYHIATGYEQESTQYKNITGIDARPIDLRVADNRNILLAREFLPFASQYIQSYGLRLLKPETAPITIYGGINEEFADKSTGRVSLYVDALKHLPIKKGV